MISPDILPQSLIVDGDKNLAGWQFLPGLNWPDIYINGRLNTRYGAAYLKRDGK